MNATPGYWGMLVAVLVGSALGGVARFWLSAALGRWLGARFPWGTLVVNVSGALLAGGLAAVMATMLSPGSAVLLQTLLVAGVCGSFTTVSSFALQTHDLVQEARWLAAGANVLASFALGLMAAWLGWMFGEAVAMWSMVPS